jgi:transketolase
MGAILEALDKADEIRGQPKIIIARTIKARGIPFAEGRPEYHKGIMTADQYAEACRILTAEVAAP